MCGVERRSDEARVDGSGDELLESAGGGQLERCHEMFVGEGGV